MNDINICLYVDRTSSFFGNNIVVECIIYSKNSVTNGRYLTLVIDGEPYFVRRIVAPIKKDKFGNIKIGSNIRVLRKAIVYPRTEVGIQQKYYDLLISSDLTVVKIGMEVLLNENSEFIEQEMNKYVSK